MTTTEFRECILDDLEKCLERMRRAGVIMFDDLDLATLDIAQLVHYNLIARNFELHFLKLKRRS